MLISNKFRFSTLLLWFGEGGVPGGNVYFTTPGRNVYFTSRDPWMRALNGGPWMGGGHEPVGPEFDPRWYQRLRQFLAQKHTKIRTRAPQIMRRPLKHCAMLACLYLLVWSEWIFILISLGRGIKTFQIEIRTRDIHFTRPALYHCAILTWIFSSFGAHVNKTFGP